MITSMSMLVKQRSFLAPLKRRCLTTFNLDQIDKILAGVNAEFSEVLWFYPAEGSFENDRYVVYNYLDKVWYFGTLARTAWLDRGTRTFPLATDTTVCIQPRIWL